MSGGDGDSGETRRTYLHQGAVLGAEERGDAFRTLHDEVVGRVRERLPPVESSDMEFDRERVADIVRT